MQEIRSSNPPVVTGIFEPNKSRARHHRCLKLGSKLKYRKNKMNFFLFPMCCLTLTTLISLMSRYDCLIYEYGLDIFFSFRRSFSGIGIWMHIIVSIWQSFRCISYIRWTVYIFDCCAWSFLINIFNFCFI